MKTDFLVWAVLVASLSASSVTGWAANSAQKPFDQFLREQHYGPVITDMYRDQEVVDTLINGQKIRFIVASGFSFTAIKKSTAWDLGLKIRPSHKENFGFDGRLFGISGYAPISSFTIQGWALNRPAEMEVFPGEESGLESGGLLGYDYLKLNNAIILAGNAGFLLRPGITTPAVGLSTYMKSSGFSPVPLRIFHDRLAADGTLDGNSFVANISSNAGVTSFLQDYVERLKISIHGTGQKAISEPVLRTRMVPLSTFSFKSMTLGKFQVPGMEIYAGSFETMRESHIDCVIGKDFLSEHHAIIDAGSDTLWLK